SIRADHQSWPEFGRTSRTRHGQDRVAINSRVGNLRWPVGGNACSTGPLEQRGLEFDMVEPQAIWRVRKVVRPAGWRLYFAIANLLPVVLRLGACLVDGDVVQASLAQFRHAPGMNGLAPNSVNELCRAFHQVDGESLTGQDNCQAAPGDATADNENVRPGI